MTTAPPAAPADADRRGRASRPAPGWRPVTAHQPPAPLRGGRRWSWSGALVFLLVKGLGSALDFYLPANQAVAQKATLGTKTFNLEGVVEPGSIHATGTAWTSWSPGVHPVQVANTGSPPQLFQPNIPVIAVGHFSGDHLRLRPDPGQALVDLHRRPPRPGDRPQRDQAMTADRRAASTRPAR